MKVGLCSRRAGLPAAVQAGAWLGSSARPFPPLGCLLRTLGGPGSSSPLCVPCSLIHSSVCPSVRPSIHPFVIVIHSVITKYPLRARPYTFGHCPF